MLLYKSLLISLFCFLSNFLLELLERSLALLNKSQQLTDFIEKFKCDGPNVNPKLMQGARNSCLKIDSLLELLQDRRRQLDKYLKQQRQELSQVLQICQWDQQENQVTPRGIDDVLTSADEVWLLCGLVISWVSCHGQIPWSLVQTTMLFSQASNITTNTFIFSH